MVGFKKKYVRFKKQNYDDIKKHHCEQGTLFVDPTFPGIDAVIGTSSIPPNIEWKRPGELCSDPRLFVDIETSRTVRAGELSCNWVVSAFAILADVSELRNRVIPDYWGQEWTKIPPPLPPEEGNGELEEAGGSRGKPSPGTGGGTPDYCGVFQFRLWRFGAWHEVVIDDLLPTVEGTLLTTQAGADNEFWTSLLEKAYAKLHGSYDGLREGELCDALVDFTGGVSEVVSLREGDYQDSEEKRSQLLDMLIQELADHSIICLSIDADMPSDIGSRTDLGLSRGHAYHITDVKKVYLGETGLRNLFKGRERVAMVRLRNPREEGKLPTSSPGSPQSGGSGEKFAYSTSTLSRLRSRNLEWQKVKDSERHRLGLLFRDHTEFWMPLEDVVAEFSELVLCRLVTENTISVSGRRKWRVASAIGRWRPPEMSGGGDIGIESFLKNPQFLVDIRDGLEVIIQLLQFHSIEGLDSPTDHKRNLYISFHIIKVEENRATKLHKLWSHCSIVVALEHQKRREVNYRGRLPHGRYLFVLSTKNPGEKAQFTLRIFSKIQLNLRELEVDIPKRMMPCSCILSEIEWVTVITIHRAEELSRPATWGSGKLNPYCVILCEGMKVKTEVARDEVEPTWNQSFIFYRKKIDKPIILQLFTHNTVMPDELVGESELAGVVTHSLTPHGLPLHPKSSKSHSTDSTDNPPSAPSNVGTLHLTILTEDNLYAV